jgi:hypothetical protein
MALLARRGIASHARGRWFEPSRAHVDLQGFLDALGYCWFVESFSVAQSVAQRPPIAQRTGRRVLPPPRRSRGSRA